MDTPDNNSDSFSQLDSYIIKDIKVLELLVKRLPLQIFLALTKEPRTPKQVATHLGVPVTRLYYHIKILEKQQLIRVTHTRTVSGITEHFYQSIARSLDIDPSLFVSVPKNAQWENLRTMFTFFLESTHEDLRSATEKGAISFEHKSPHPESLILRRGYLRLTREQAATMYSLFEDVIKNTSDLETAASDASWYHIDIIVHPLGDADK